MKIARSFIAKILSLICSLLGIPLLFSCDDDSAVFKTETEEPCLYGMPPNYGQFIGTVSGDVHDTGKKSLLPNVKIYSESENFNKSGTISEEGYIFKTDGEGRFYIDLWESGDYVFRFEDGDGAENGSFKTLKKTITYTAGTDVHEDITMEKE